MVDGPPVVEVLEESRVGYLEDLAGKAMTMALVGMVSI